MSVQPKVGEWAVFGNYGYVALEIQKVTDKMTMTKSAYGGRGSSHHRTGELLFSGPQAVAEKLVERLVSSRALADEEKMRAGQRHRERQAKLIADAQGATP